MYLQHPPGSLNLQCCLITHSFDSSPKILNLKQVADQYERQDFPLTEVILQLPKVLEDKVHV